MATLKTRDLEGHINLQLFAEQQEVDPQEQTEVVEEVKTFTEEEVQKMLQSEADKRVSEALKTARSKWEVEKEQEKEEAEKLASMSEAERQQAIMEQQKQEFERERALFQKEKLELQITKEMAEKNLPVQFAELLVTDNAETSLNNIKLFEESWKEALDLAVQEKLKSPSIKRSETTFTEKVNTIAKLRNEQGKTPSNDPWAK